MRSIKQCGKQEEHRAPPRMLNNTQTFFENLLNMIIYVWLVDGQPGYGVV